MPRERPTGSPGLAAELVRLNVDVIVVATDPRTRAAKEASAKIPIVIVSVNYDPVELGYINNLARPGTNVTGVLFGQVPGTLDNRGGDALDAERIGTIFGMVR